MLCPTLVGRQAEARVLAEAVEAAMSGHGGLVVLAGDPGVGKSRLAGEAARIASSRGCEVLVGRGVASGTVALRPIAEALMAITRTRDVPDAPELADYWPALSSIVPDLGRGVAPDAEVSPLIVGEAVLRLLDALGGSAGTVLVLEELQWADPETLDVVEYLADSLAVRNVLCIGTLRPGEPSPASDLVHAMSARRAVTVMTVGRLADGDVGRMAAACLGQDVVPEAIIERLLPDCDGLPFAVEEILAAAVSSGELFVDDSGWHLNESVTTGVPDSIAGSVRRRLSGLGPDVVEVIRWAAVLGRQFDWTLLPDLAATTSERALKAMQKACDVQLIEPHCPRPQVFRFRHSLTREAIASDLLPPDLARRAARAAAVLEQAHPGLAGDWCELAVEMHLVAGQRADAAGLLLEAGRLALQRGALTSARRSLSRAWSVLEEVPSADQQQLVEIDDALARAAELAGDASQLIPLADRLIAGLDRIGADLTWKAEVRIRLARTLSEDYRDAAAGHLSAARGIADTMDDPRLNARLDAVAARCAIDAGDLDNAADLAQRSLGVAEAAGLHGWAAEAGSEALEIIGRREQVRDIGAAREAFGRACQIATSEGLQIRRIRAMQAIGAIDMLEEGDTARLCDARELALRAGALSTATLIGLQLASCWSIEGDLERALTAARDCQQAAARIRMRRVEAMAWCVQASIAGIRGQREDAGRAARQAERVLPGDMEILFTSWGQARVIASLFRNDIPAALAESATGISCGREARFRVPRRAWGFWALLQAVSGDDGCSAIEEARAHRASFARFNRGWLAYAEALLEGRACHPDRAAELAEHGRVQFLPFGPWWNHLARRMVAPAAVDDGWGQPAAWLREAIPDFDAQGLDQLAAACRGILRRAGERVPRQGRGDACVPGQLRRIGVTSREMDVLLLVARGWSNRQIAVQLVVSPKTVETHVASLIAKTGQANRMQLVAFAAGAIPAGDSTQPAND